MLLKAFLVSMGLWVGTLIYCFVLHPSMLMAEVIDRCWFEFVGAMALGLTEEVAQIIKERAR